MSRDDYDSSERGFMPLAQGAALVEAASSADAGLGPFLEVGSYRGKSASYLGPIAQQLETVLFCVDSHRVAVDEPLGWERGGNEMSTEASVAEDLAARSSAPIDTLPEFRQTIVDTKLEDSVIAVVGMSHVVAKYWLRGLSLLFLNGGRSEEELTADYQGWVNKVALGGLLIIADVISDPEYGDTQPYELLYLPVMESAEFEELRVVESLCILRRVAPPLTSA